MSVNRVILVGRLGKDPETRYTPSGQAVCNFSMATDESFKDRTGERQKRTEWHRIVLWGKLGEIAQQYLKKGSLVYIEGRIQTREWDDKNSGQKKYFTDIVGSTMRMLGSKSDSGGMRESIAPSHAAPADDFNQAGGDDAGAAAPAPEISDEDIPF